MFVFNLKHVLCVHRAFTAASVEVEEGKQTHEITEREAQGEGKTKQEEVECGFEEKQNEVWTIDTDTFILLKCPFRIQDRVRSGTRRE